MKYIVWFSGGIDSTFVAYYLKNQGHEVLLVNLKNTVWYNKCCSVPIDLMKIANFLWLPLKIVDVVKEFKQLVIDDFVENYLKWNTPNPCVNCNERVRFKVLEEIRQQMWYDFVSTGHYVKKEKIFDNVYSFSVPKDIWKDQSYMLYRLIKYQNILKHLDFPLFKFKKEEVKENLKKINIPLDTSKESQNICFIPDDDYPRFIKQMKTINIPWWKIVDTNWNYLWEHKWLIYYTVWQRKWLNLNTNEKKYVVKIDWENNILVVGDEKDLLSTKVKLAENIILLPWFDKNLFDKIYWKIRYKWKLEEVEQIENRGVVFKKPLRAITPGQHLVLYWEKDWKLVVIWWWIIWV